jgi:hypothetical protein
VSATFKNKIRFKPTPFSQESMQRIGQKFRDSIVERIERGENVSDSAAKPLKGDTHDDRYIPYAQQKLKKGLQGIRDLVKSGRTLKAIQVVRASATQGVIAANNPVADRILHKNNQIENMFGVSPKDRAVLQQAVKDEIKQHPLFKIESSS